MSNKEFSQQTLNLFNQHHWPQLDLPHLRYGDIEPVVNSLCEHACITRKQIGASYGNVPVYRLSVGTGPLCVLAWTQMHGDEPTATAAVLDWLNMLIGDKPNGLPCDWAQRISLHIIPMLNPDGAAQKTRHNGQGIDINRDAIALQSPEGRILASQVEQLKPAVAFNLHDQNPYYTVGESTTPATVSFLAPAFNQAKDVDSARLRAKKVIAAMHAHISPYLPNGVGRYDDSYSYRSFGDNIARAGASTILIESGAYHNDPHRQMARKMNVLALHTALRSLLENTYEQYSLDDYYAIGANREEGMVDIKVSAVTTGSPAFTCDLAINNDVASGKFRIEAVGDLSNQAGFVEIDGSSAQIWPRRGFEVAAPLNLNRDVYLELLCQGYCFFYGQTELLRVETSLPVLICEDPDPLPACLRPGDPAFFILYQDDSAYLAILEGEVLLLAP